MNVRKLDTQAIGTKHAAFLRIWCALIRDITCWNPSALIVQSTMPVGFGSRPRDGKSTPTPMRCRWGSCEWLCYSPWGYKTHCKSQTRRTIWCDAILGDTPLITPCRVRIWPPTFGVSCLGSEGIDLIELELIEIRWYRYNNVMMMLITMMKAQQPPKPFSF